MKTNTQEYNWLTNPSGSGYRLSAAINGFLTLSMVAICIVVSYLPIAAEVAIAVTRALLPASMICGIILNSAVEKTRMPTITPLPELVGRYFRVLVG